MTTSPTPSGHDVADGRTSGNDGSPVRISGPVGKPSGRTTRLTRRTLVLALLVLGGASVLSAVPTWLSTTGSTALDKSVAVTVSGTTAAPAVSAAALVVVAAGLALGLVGAVTRWIALVVVALGGVVVAASGLSLILSPEAAARSGVADTTGVSGAVSDVTVSAAPYVTVVLGTVIVLLAVWAMAAPISWASRTSRYDTTGAARGHASSPDAGTTSPGDEQQGHTTDEAAPGSLDRAEDGQIDERDAWDALSKGEDPT